MKKLGTFSACRIGIEILSPEKDVEYLFRDRYGPFMDRHESVGTLEIVFNDQLDHTAAPDIDIQDSPEELTARSSALELRYDKSKNSGTLEIADYYLFFPVENALRVLYSRLLPTGSSALVHAAAIKGRTSSSATLFPGESGAGKTTLAESARERGAVVLGDDLVFIFRENDGWVVESSPFTGQEKMEIDCISAPLGKVAFLEGREETKLTPIKAPSGAALMFACMPFQQHLENSRTIDLLELAGQAVKSVPVFKASHLLNSNPEVLWECR